MVLGQTKLAMALGRRALWPAFATTGAFAGAAWFGCFEVTWSVSKLLMPVPAAPDPTARVTGWITLPVITGMSAFMGWTLSPNLAPPPASVTDLVGLVGYMRSWPISHFAFVGATSAVTAAVTCRIVQYRGGA